MKALNYLSFITQFPSNFTLTCYGRFLHANTKSLVAHTAYLLFAQILKRGCGVNDRDGLTDMSLLHYCCKAGAPGIGKY